jgi:hypothetical protein
MLSLSRWWPYQRERFPVFVNSLLITAFSFSALSYSFMLRDGTSWVGIAPMIVTSVPCFLFYLQLRIADEFNGFEEGSRFRPYRPVPRGLISLEKLAVLWFVTGVVQLFQSFLLALSAVPYLYKLYLANG